MIKESGIADFNWDKYDNWNGKTLTENKSLISNQPSTKVYSREPYAPDLLNFYDNSKVKIINKDLNKGELVPVTDILYLDEIGKMIIEILGGLTINIDLTKEKRFLNLFNFSLEEFVKSLNNEESKKQFIDQGFFVYITESNPIKASIILGHIKNTESKFIEEIKNINYIKMLLSDPKVSETLFKDNINNYKYLAQLMLYDHLISKK